MTPFIQIMLIYNDLVYEGKEVGSYSYFADVDDETITNYLIETRIGKETFNSWDRLNQNAFLLAIRCVFCFENMIDVRSLEKNDNFINWLKEHERNKAQSCFEEEIKDFE